MAKVVVLFHGCPGSGKSTLSRRLSESFAKEAWDVQLIEYDQIEKSLTGSPSASGVPIQAWRQARVLAAAATERFCEQGAPSGVLNRILILDDTFHLPSMRKQILRVAAAREFAMVQVAVVAPLEDCKRRNSERQARDRVPDFVVERHFGMMEASRGAYKDLFSAEEQTPVRLSTDFSSLEKWETAAIGTGNCLSLIADGSACTFEACELLKEAIIGMPLPKRDATDSISESTSGNFEEDLLAMESALRKIIGEALRSEPEKSKSTTAIKLRKEKEKAMAEYREILRRQPESSDPGGITKGMILQKFMRRCSSAIGQD